MLEGLILMGRPSADLLFLLHRYHAPTLTGIKYGTALLKNGMNAVSTALRCSFVFVLVRAIHRTLPQTAL